MSCTKNVNILLNTLNKHYLFISLYMIRKEKILLFLLKIKRMKNWEGKMDYLLKSFLSF